MKFTAIATLVAAVAAIPYTPPADQPDGVYGVNFDEAGQPLVQRLADPNYAPAAESQVGEAQAVEAEATPQLLKRAREPYCSGLYIPQDGSYKRVQDCLGNWLDANSGNVKRDGGAVIYCRSGDTFLALCSYPETIYGSSKEITNFNANMDVTCGAWKSGYVFYDEWNKSYYRTMAAEPICTNIDAHVQLPS